MIRVGFECKVTTKVVNLGVVIYQPGISWYTRPYVERKNIDWRDGFRALRAISKCDLLH